MSDYAALGIPGARLIGRERELRLLAPLLGDARRSGRALLIDGEAGIGKSSLLAALADEAVRDGYRLLRCTGLEHASPVGYTALHQLLGPLLPQMDALPPRQRDALATAFALVDGPAPDRLLVSIAALGLLEEASAEQPLFIAVEDLHWIDRSTAHVIEFMSLRLAQSPILLVATARPSWDVSTTISYPMERLELGPLDADASRRLLAESAAGMSESMRARVLREASGNPLALQELSAALGAPGVRASLRSVLPTTNRLEQAFLSQVSRVPDRSRAFLLLAAVAEDAGMLDILDAARLLGLDLGDLTPLETAGMVRVVDERPVFRHPILRAAIQGSASTSELQRTHAALSRTVRDPARAAWHRASATFERDELVARDIQAAGDRARVRGALDEAAAAYQRAATLSESQEKRATRLTLAAEAARGAGLGAAALELMEEAERIATDPATIAALATARSTLSLTTGLTGHTRADLDRILSQLEGPQNADRRAEVLWGAAMNARGRNLPPAEWERIEQDLRSIETASPLKPIALALLAPLGYVEDDIRALLPTLVPALDHFPLGMVSLAVAAESMQDLETALTCWGLARERFHDLGAPADEVQALRGRAGILLLRGRIREGLADAEYAARMAHDTAQPLMESMCLATVARANAMLGEPDATLEALRRLRELSSVFPLAMASADARWAAGIVALAQNRYRDSMIEFTHMSVHPTRALWAVADRTEAAVRADRVDTIRQNVANAERASTVYRSPFLTSVVERSKALIADADGDSAGAGEHFELAVQAGEFSESPFELARTHLLFGEWLRRERHPIDARPHLSRALAVFESVSAKMLADRAAAELRAAGATPARLTSPSTTSVAALTPQELQVALLAARGMSNKEIADRIYLSHRTVSTHLYKAFPKLSITSRAQLRDALTNAGYTI